MAAHLTELAGEARKSREIFRYEEDPIELLRNLTYAEQIVQGYRWIMNSPVRGSDYESRDFDVIVHEVAFDIRGAVLPNHRAILMKARNKNQHIG
ncbi:MAG: hypothetical protein Q8Q31_05960 [Nanoarchaeota archaeon]|nr:hypothetical protein [Nanoarchaeota archaeon]